MENLPRNRELERVIVENTQSTGWFLFFFNKFVE